MNSNPQIDTIGTKRWFNEKGELHRDGDLPAVEWKNGTKIWYKNGKRHRDGDNPAVECENEYREWWKNGMIHREQDKPAVEYPSGAKLYTKNGKHLNVQEVRALKNKWEAIRNGDTDLLAEELLNVL